MLSRPLYWLSLLGILVILTGCSLVEDVTEVGWQAAKLTGKLTSKAVVGAAHIAQGKQVVKLKRIGNSLFTESVVNRKTRALLMIDTGASNVLLSKRMAKRAGINLRSARPTKAKLAGGRVVPARVVMLKELRVGNASVNNIPAIILEQEGSETYDGLLGMSFLNQFVFQIDTVKGELVLQKRK